MERERERKRENNSLSFFLSPVRRREETGFRSERFCAVYLAGWRGGREVEWPRFLLFSKLHAPLGRKSTGTVVTAGKMD